MVLVSSGMSYSPPPPSLGALQRLAQGKFFRRKGLLGALAGEMYGGKARSDSSMAAHMLTVQMLHARPFGSWEQFLAGVGWTSAWFLPLLAQRMLVLNGTDDPVVHPIQGRLIALLARRSELHLYRGGHLDLLINPKELLPEIEAFLARGCP